MKRLLLLLALGCAGELEEARDAASERWHAATGLRPDYSRMRFVKEIADCGGVIGASGCHHCSTGEIKIAVRLWNQPELLEALVIHEGGHALMGCGTFHLPPQQGIMSPRVDLRCLRTADVALICGAADCAWQKPECP
jgi:hypothetical protein